MKPVNITSYNNHNSKNNKDILSCDVSGTVTDLHALGVVLEGRQTAGRVAPAVDGRLPRAVAALLQTTQRSTGLGRAPTTTAVHAGVDFTPQIDHHHESECTVYEKAHDWNGMSVLPQRR